MEKLAKWIEAKRQYCRDSEHMYSEMLAKATTPEEKEYAIEHKFFWQGEGCALTMALEEVKAIAKAEAEAVAKII